MLAEVNKAKHYLTEKFGSLENVKPGVYAVPIDTSKGKSFMKVEITPEMGIRGFNLFKNEELTVSWYE